MSVHSLTQNPIRTLLISDILQSRLPLPTRLRKNKMTRAIMQYVLRSFSPGVYHVPVKSAQIRHHTRQLEKSWEPHNALNHS